MDINNKNRCRNEWQRRTSSGIDVSEMLMEPQLVSWRPYGECMATRTYVYSAYSNRPTAGQPPLSALFYTILF